MPASNVRSRFVDGDLVFKDAVSGDTLLTIKADGTIVVATALTVAGVTVDETTLAADEQAGGNVAEVADVNVIGGIPVLHRITAAALTGDVDVTLTHKTRVLDVWCVAVGAGAAADTIIVKNGATAITDTMDLNVADKIIVRALTIDDAQHEIAAAGTLKVSGASAVTCEVYVLGIRVA